MMVFFGCCLIVIVCGSFLGIIANNLSAINRTLCRIEDILEDEE